MKVVILCGGQGTRIRDVSEVLPKPMLTIGGKPILWHIMKIYSHFGHNDFILCLGYKGWVIKEYFLNYMAKSSDFTVELGHNGQINYHNENEEADWKVTCVDTGENSLTGKRLLNVRQYLDDEDSFALTYGDGVSDIDINKLAESHHYNGVAVTLTGVQPMGRFGEIEKDGTIIKQFNEKPNVSTGLINGGFMIFNTTVFDKYFDSTANQSLESDILPKIVDDGQAAIFEHPGAWMCVDTAREYQLLNQLWDKNQAFWRLDDSPKQTILEK